jgi:hypothetical protein
MSLSYCEPPVFRLEKFLNLLHLQGQVARLLAFWVNLMVRTWCAFDLLWQRRKHCSKNECYNLMCALKWVDRKYMMNVSAAQSGPGASSRRPRAELALTRSRRKSWRGRHRHCDRRRAPLRHSYSSRSQLCGGRWPCTGRPRRCGRFSVVGGRLLQLAVAGAGATGAGFVDTAVIYRSPARPNDPACFASGSLAVVRGCGAGGIGVGAGIGTKQFERAGLHDGNGIGTGC